MVVHCDTAEWKMLEKAPARRRPEAYFYYFGKNMQSRDISVTALEVMDGWTIDLGRQPERIEVRHCSLNWRSQSRRYNLKI